MPIIRRSNCINTASGIVLSVSDRPVCNESPLVTCVLNGHLKRMTVPDAVIIQFVLLKMSIIVLETCRGV